MQLFLSIEKLKGHHRVINQHNFIIVSQGIGRPQERKRDRVTKMLRVPTLLGLTVFSQGIRLTRSIEKTCGLSLLLQRTERAALMDWQVTRAEP